ncbi:MAG: hypothetical protein OHK0022_23260 [Roseiflexaceae bacterium]
MDDMRREMNIKNYEQAPPTPDRVPQSVTDKAVIAAIRALLSEQPLPELRADSAQDQELSIQIPALAAMAELLNDLTNNGLIVWREGRHWCWRWDGSDLIADMNRLGLGDAVLDAVTARNASTLGRSLA